MPLLTSEGIRHTLAVHTCRQNIHMHKIINLKVSFIASEKVATSISPLILRHINSLPILVLRESLTCIALAVLE